jgi:ABC-2 type transport system ATP-binding protein
MTGALCRSKPCIAKISISFATPPCAKIHLVIALKDLQKVVDNKTVLNIKSLALHSGEIAALVGAVDSGRDILFDLLTGRTRPTTGTVRIAGLDPYAERADFSRRVGVLFEEDNLYKRQSALSNLEFYARLHRLPRARAREVLEKVGLGDQAGSSVDKLSSSLSRRLAFGRAILHNPQVLILMEPFAKCDDTSINLLSSLVRERADSGAALFILADDPAGLEEPCGTIYRLEHGLIVEAYEPQEAQQRGMPFMIPARLEEKIILVDPGDILFIFAQGDHTYLQTSEDCLPTQFTLVELERRLARSGFFRAHRGYLVNLQHVKEVIPYTRDSFSLRLKDSAGTKIPLSKTAARELRELLGY